MSQHAMQLHGVFASDPVIVMDKTPLDSAVQEKVMQRVTLEVFMDLQSWKFLHEKNFYNISVVMRIMKIFCYRNLVLYGILCCNK